MQLLATSPQIVFDDRYPSEYRFLSYFARVATMMTEPLDEQRHVGVTPFFFSGEQQQFIDTISRGLDLMTMPRPTGVTEGPIGIDAAVLAVPSRRLARVYPSI